MKPEELVLTARVEEKNPTDRVRGTVVSVDPCGMFVIKYDNGDYLAFQSEQAEEFKLIPEQPIPSHAADLMRHLRKKHGRTPPEDVAKIRKIPGARTNSPPIGEKSSNPALTRDADAPYD